MGGHRAVGSGNVTFGMVTVPVRLFVAAEGNGGVSFNLLHAKCGSRVKQQYVCPKEGDVITRADMVKGHEFAKDQYVTFTEEEIKGLLEAPSPAIEISEFVPAEKVDPVFFNGAYYVGPDKGGDTAYALLATALHKTGRCAIARWSARGREHLVMIRAGDHVPGAAHPALVLQVLHLADEVRSAEDIATHVDVGARELKLAIELIKRGTSDAFRPEAYKDGARERIEAAIARKVKGEEVLVNAPAAGDVAPTVDLLSALQASLTKKPAARARRRAA